MARSSDPKRTASLRPGALALACAVAGVAALWALFQWTELRVARSGGDSFCGFGGGDGCAQVWDSPFARAVQEWTGIPVAGWGLIWAFVAFAFPLLTLLRRADGKAADEMVAASGWTALAGVLGVMTLAGVLAAEGTVCTTCLGTHALVLVYAGCVLAGGARLAPRRGAGFASIGAALGFLVLLFPGLRTPSAPDAASIPGLAQDAPERAAPAGLPSDLAGFIDGLPEGAKQNLADTLAMHLASPATPLPEPRALVGSPLAPVRITEFADILCGHCRNLHLALDQIKRNTPPGAFSVEPRFFPLDGACNDNIPRASDDAVRCIAARAQICLAQHEEGFRYSGELFEKQRSLDEATIYEVAAPFVPEAELRRCVASADTERELQRDIALAMTYDIHGTPLVLVNGREAPAYPPLLYAMILASGDPEHPAFAALPEPRPIEPGGHEGHGH